MLQNIQECRDHFEHLVAAARDTFGGDFDGAGLARAVETGLAETMLAHDDEYKAVVFARNAEARQTRSTAMGLEIGKLLGQAYNLGSYKLEVSHV